MCSLQFSFRTPRWLESYLGVIKMNIHLPSNSRRINVNRALSQWRLLRFS